MITHDFIIKELKTTVDPKYFAFLYCKLFSISQDNVDILTLYEFFSSDKRDLAQLKSKITDNIYYIPDSEDINNKFLQVGGEYRDAILKNLKAFISKNQNIELCIQLMVQIQPRMLVFLLINLSLRLRAQFENEVLIHMWYMLP
jgi:hypothetical protein